MCKNVLPAVDLNYESSWVKALASAARVMRHAEASVLAVRA